jgi:tetrathionate reductase complex response regulator
MPNPLPSDQRRFAAESPFDAAFGYGSAPISTPTSEGRHDSSQTAGRAADEDGLQPADTPAELTGPVWVVDDDDVRESLTFALQPRFEAASYPTLEAFLTQADLMQPGCLVIADRFAGLNESSLDEFNVQHELELRRSPVTVVFLSSLANIRAAVRALRQGAVSFLEKPVDPEELGDAVAEGLERALRRAQRNRLAERFESLSKREQQIFVLICRGLKNGDIAALLELSQRTVEVHRAHISRKLGDAAPIRLLYELILAEGETLFNVSFDGIRPEGLAKVFAATK